MHALMIASRPSSGFACGDFLDMICAWMFAVPQIAHARYPSLNVPVHGSSAHDL